MGIFAQAHLSHEPGKSENKGPSKVYVSNLEKRLKNADAKLRIDILLELGEHFTDYTKSAPAVRCAKDALNAIHAVEAPKKRTGTWKARAWLIIGIGKRRQDKPAEALEILNKAESLSQELENQKLLIRARSALGYTYNRISKHDRALSYFKKCLPYLEKNKETSKLIHMYAMSGWAYMRMGNYKKALELQLKSLSTAENSQYKNALVTSLIALG